MKNISLPLPESQLQHIDALRGDVPRTVWIRRAIEERIKKVEAEYDGKLKGIKR